MNSDDSTFTKFLVPLFAGAIAGCSAVLVTNPIDLAKTRLQLQGELQKKGQYNKQLNGVTDTLIKTAKNEGFRALYKGLPPAFVFQIVMNGFRLGMYENLKSFCEKRIKPSQTLNMINSGLVGFVGGFFGSPFNMIKTRIMLQSNFLENGNRYQYTGFFNAVQTIYNLDGFKGLFKGSRLWGIRTAMGSAVQLPAFDRSKFIIQEQLGMKGLPGLMIASAFSTMLLCVFMCPIDSLATRYLSQTFDAQGQGLLYRNIFQGAKDIQRIEGFPGFYKGFTAFFVRVFPQSFISLLIFSNIMQQIRKQKI